LNGKGELEKLAIQLINSLSLTFRAARHRVACQAAENFHANDPLNSLSEQFMFAQKGVLTKTRAKKIRSHITAEKAALCVFAIKGANFETI